MFFLNNVLMMNNVNFFQVHTADTDHTGYKHVVQLTDDFKIVGINGSRILKQFFHVFTSHLKA